MQAFGFRFLATSLRCVDACCVHRYLLLSSNDTSIGLWFAFQVPVDDVGFDRLWKVRAMLDTIGKACKAQMSPGQILCKDVLSMTHTCFPHSYRIDSTHPHPCCVHLL